MSSVVGFDHSQGALAVPVPWSLGIGSSAALEDVEKMMWVLWTVERWNNCCRSVVAGVLMARDAELPSGAEQGVAAAVVAEAVAVAV